MRIKKVVRIVLMANIRINLRLEFFVADRKKEWSL